MIKKILLAFLGPETPLTTYNTGLLQAKAYRALKHHTHSILKPYNISSLDWALLGVLFDQVNGYKLNELSQLLGIEPPFASVMVGALEEKKLVQRISSEEDKRAKVITLTQTGRELVPVIEQDLRKKMKFLLKGTNLPSVYAYIQVLNTIVRNAEEV